MRWRAGRLSQRVENILQSNRLVSGKAMNREPFDAEHIVKEAIQRNQTGIPRSSIELTTSNKRWASWKAMPMLRPLPR